MELKGRVAVVTGAGRGIGRGAAVLLAGAGAKVVVNDLGGVVTGEGESREPADLVVEEIKKAGGDAVASYDTVATMEGAERIINAAIDNYGRIDILVNNAGNFRGKMIFNMTEDDWDSVISTHLKGHFGCTRFASLYMRQQRSGRIINVTSDAARGEIGGANYCAAKAGIVGFTYAVARDMARYNVTCNAIAPLAATRMAQFAEDIVADRKRSGKQLVKNIITGFSDPAEIAPVFLYLASDEAAGVSGQVIGMGGGKISLWGQPGPERYFYYDSPLNAKRISELFKGAFGAGKSLMPETIYF